MKMPTIQYRKPLDKDDGVVSAIMEDGTAVPQYKIIRAKQCQSGQRHNQQCQGPLGHEGDHWCYGQNGWFHHWPNTTKKLRKWDIAYSSTPPGHDAYPHPAVMMERCYTAFTKYVDMRQKSKREIKQPGKAEYAKLIAKRKRQTKIIKKRHKAIDDEKGIAGKAHRKA